MSLFENDEYQWRETYFVLLKENNRPAAGNVTKALQRLDPRYRVVDVREDEHGRCESLTLLAPDDYAAMDISYVAGEEVVEQMPGLAAEMNSVAMDNQQKKVIAQVPECNARFDVFHFEQLTFIGGDEEDEEFMDPGTLLIVLDKIAELCNGIVVDPQSGSLLN